jgi:hypothetical protein
MTAKGFGDSDPVRRSRGTHEKEHALWTPLHYLSMGAFSREFDVAEKTAKMRRRSADDSLECPNEVQPGSLIIAALVEATVTPKEYDDSELVQYYLRMKCDGIENRMPNVEVRIDQMG